MASRSLAFIFVMAGLLFYGGQNSYLKNEKVNEVNKVTKKSQTIPDLLKPQRSPSSLMARKTPTRHGVTPHFEEVKNLSPEPLVSRIPAQDNKELQTDSWRLSPMMSWKQLTSEDENQFIASKIKAISRTNLGLSFSYGIDVHEELKLFTTLETEAVSFVDDSDSVELKNKKFLLNRVAAGANVKSSWFFELGMADKLFLVAPSLTTIDIEKVTLPEVKAKYRKDFYKLREAILSYGVSGNLFLPGKGATVESQEGFGAGIIVEAKFKNRGFGIGYEKNYLKATGNSTNMDNIFWRFTWEAF